MHAFLSAAFPAQPIWLQGGGADDEYADFLPEIRLHGGTEYRLRIAADSDYSVYAGDELVGFGQYPDYPHRVIYDDIVFTAESDAALRVTAWHVGTDSQTHIRHTAYVAFCLYEGGRVIYATSEKTPSRLSAEYMQHRCARITSQLGLGFSLDGRTEPAAPAPSAAADPGDVTVCPRSNRRLVWGERLTGTVVKSGRYRTENVPDAALYMKNADLAASASCGDAAGAANNAAAGKNGAADNRAAGAWVLFDLGREAVGFPELSFTADGPCRVCVGWGEHIADGMCRCAIHNRRFTFEYAAHEGANRVFPVLRRLGCRYLQVFIEGHPRDVRLRFAEVLYPVEVKPTALTGLRRKIFDTAVHTLRCCMHEHYEDCPWREQALYTLDSRNQMLAGYAAFEGGNTEMARASLDLISRGVRPDGLLTLCDPAGLDFPIPFYTLAYFLQVREYAEFSGDIGFVREKKPMLDGLMRTVLSRMREGGRFDGLVPRWDDKGQHIWNFYEWSPGMDGGKHLGDGVFDAPFNAALVLALRAYAAALTAAGFAGEADGYLQTAERVRTAIARTFARPDGFFASFRGEDTDSPPDCDARVSVLTQALVLLSGAADGKDTEKMLRVVAANGGEDTVPATLSMACFRYDALLCADASGYAPVILREIDRDGEEMLAQGATTFFETRKGEKDFDGAGSLCHGWSAMAAYYYRKLCEKE